MVKSSWGGEISRLREKLGQTWPACRWSVVSPRSSAQLPSKSQENNSIFCEANIPVDGQLVRILKFRFCRYVNIPERGRSEFCQEFIADLGSIGEPSGGSITLLLHFSISTPAVCADAHAEVCHIAPTSSSSYDILRSSEFMKLLQPFLWKNPYIVSHNF